MASGFPSIGRRQCLRVLAGSAMAATLPAPVLDGAGVPATAADQRKALRGQRISSHAFRDGLDTDGFDHPQQIYELTGALIRRGYSDTDIGLVPGGNFRRLLGDVLG